MELKESHAPSVILLADNNEQDRAALKTLLDQQGYHTLEAGTPEAAEQLLREHTVDLVITDLPPHKKSGIDTVKHIRSVSPDVEIIVLAEHATVENAVEAIHTGAFDYVAKPFLEDKILIKIERALQHKSMSQELSILREHVAMSFGFDNIVGVSPLMTKLKETARRIAPTDITTLITGASGTGKELLAKAIHYHSRRRNQRLVIVDCTSIPETLIESELFGHMKGSFTSATETKRGLLEEADGGTLFLDEVHNLSFSMQMKFLRFLQDSEIRAVGSSITKKVDVRIIAASNRDLTTMIAEGSFREDLFYRLNVIPLRIPKLAERKEDIELLADYFLRKIAHEMGKPPVQITPDAMERLSAHNWPGNVRELENTLKRALALTNGNQIAQNNIQFIGSTATKQTEPSAPELSVRRPLADSQRDIIRKALEENQWNFTQTAQELGIGRTTLWRKVKKYNLSREALAQTN